VKSYRLITFRKVYSILNWGTHVGGFSRVMKILFVFFGGFASKIFQTALTAKLYKRIDGADKTRKDTDRDQQEETQELF
jgi:hypothetical protein